MKAFKKLAGIDERPDPKPWYDEINEGCTLSYTTRLYGFCICAGIGILISFISTMFVPQIPTHPEKFAIMYTLGNLISLISTAFLIGPFNQIKNMFKPVRIIATIVFFLAIGLTLFMAIKVKSTIGVIIAIVIQMCAYTWYVLSYIPFARSMVKKCCSSIVSV